MFGLDWTELAIIAGLALIFVGPKELPGVLRNVARWVNKARGLAREFQSGVDEMIREAELDEARKSIEAAAKVDLKQEIEKAIDPTGDVSGSLRIEPPTTATVTAASASETSVAANGSGGVPAAGASEPVAAPLASLEVSTAQAIPSPSAPQPESLKAAGSV